MVGISLSLAMCSPCCGENSHTCPDYPQHDEVLRGGLESLKDSSAASNKWQPPPIPREIMIEHDPSSVKGFPTLDQLAKPINQQKPAENASKFDFPPAKDPDEAGWLPCLRAAISLGSTPKRYIASYGDERKEIRRIFKQPSLETLKTWRGPQIGYAPETTSSQLLGALLDYPEGSSFLIDTELLSSARVGLESLRKSSANIPWQNYDLLCLAGLRAWFGDFDSALSLCDEIANNTPIRFALVDMTPLIKNYTIAINYRKGDWQQLRALEDECVAARECSPCNTLSEIYTARGRTQDLLRIFRRTFEWQFYNSDKFKVIIQHSEDEDVPRIAIFVQRHRLENFAVAEALAKKRFFGDSLTVCLNTIDPLNEEPSQVIASVRKKYPTDYVKRVVFAASICFDLGTKTYGRELLSKVSEELLDVRLDSAAAAHDNLRYLEQLISAISAMPNLSSEDVLQKLKERRDVVAKRKELLECLTLAEKLEETGNALLTRGKYAEAKKVYTSALDIRRKNLTPSDCLIGNSLQNLAQTNMMLKEMNEANQQFEECISIYKQASAADLLKSALEMYGGFLNYSGDKKKAEAVYQEAKQYSK